MNSTRYNEFLSLLQEVEDTEFYNNLLIKKKFVNSKGKNEPDWKLFCNTSLLATDEEIQNTLSNRKGKLSLETYKSFANEWIKANPIYELPTNVLDPLDVNSGETNEDRMIQVKAVFKAMGIGVDIDDMTMAKQSPLYHKARTIAIKSDVWKNRPHRNKVWATAEEAFCAEMKDVLVYLLDLSNNLEYVLNVTTKEYVLTFKREIIIPCLLHMKNRINSKLIVLFYGEVSSAIS